MFRVNLESITFLKVRENYVSRQGIYLCKEECLSFIKKQTEIQMGNSTVTELQFREILAPI